MVHQSKSLHSVAWSHSVYNHHLYRCHFTQQENDSYTKDLIWLEVTIAQNLLSLNGPITIIRQAFYINDPVSLYLTDPGLGMRWPDFQTRLQDICMSDQLNSGPVSMPLGNPRYLDVYINKVTEGPGSQRSPLNSIIWQILALLHPENDMPTGTPTSSIFESRDTYYF